MVRCNKCNTIYHVNCAYVCIREREKKGKREKDRARERESTYAARLEAAPGAISLADACCAAHWDIRGAAAE